MAKNSTKQVLIGVSMEINDTAVITKEWLRELMMERGYLTEDHFDNPDEGEGECNLVDILFDIIYDSLNDINLKDEDFKFRLLSDRGCVDYDELFKLFMDEYYEMAVNNHTCVNDDE